MRSRHRARRKKQGGSPAAATPPQSLPPDLTTEIEQSIEARDRLEAAIPGFNVQREQARPAFLRSLAASLQTQLAPNDAREKLAAWKAADTRAAEEQDALQQLLALFKERVEGFKTSSTSQAEAASALQRILARLNAELGKAGADQKAINARIGSLSTELASLRTTVSPPPPRESKDRPPPPQRTAKGKSGKSSATKK